MPQAGQPAGRVAMGDKNVIAGDVVNGDQDNRKYFGNVTSSTTEYAPYGQHHQYHRHQSG